jgi:hypothetical protein
LNVVPGHSLENVNVVVGGSTLTQPSPSRWMQYHQLLELVFEASHVSVTLYGPFTVRRRLVGAVGAPVSPGGGGGGGFFAEAPATKTNANASASTLAARTVRRTDMGSSSSTDRGRP